MFKKNAMSLSNKPSYDLVQQIRVMLEHNENSVSTDSFLLVLEYFLPSCIEKGVIV